MGLKFIHLNNSKKTGTANLAVPVKNLLLCDERYLCAAADKGKASSYKT